MTRKILLSIPLLTMPLSAQQPMLQTASQPAPHILELASEPAQQPVQQTPQSAPQPVPPSLPQSVAQSVAPPPTPQPAASATPPPAGLEWRMVEAVRPGTTLYVNAKAGHKGCKVKAVTDDALTCEGGVKGTVYPRAEIWTLKVGHRRRSALEGAIPGGVMIAVGGISLATENCKGEFLCGLGPGIVVAGGAVVAIVGATIGGLTDFSKSTIYTAP